MLIILIIAGAVLFLSKTKIPTAQASKASGNLAGVGTPGALSSTPKPTPSANNPNATPPFYQQSNAATPSEPVTTESFNPIEFTSGAQNRKGTLAAPIRTRTLHNNHILNNTFDIDNQLIQKPISSHFIKETELTSVSEEQYYSYLDNTGVPDNTQVDSIKPFTYADGWLKNAGGTNGTYPIAPKAVNIAGQVPTDHASTLAPLPSRNITIEKTVPLVASRIVKASLTPEKSTIKTNATPNIFEPLTSVYGA